MSGNYALETRYELYDHDHGTKLTIAPDSDGIGMIDVVDHETKHNLRLTYPQARLLAAALIKAADDGERNA